jgi:hypothetical protein
MALILARAMRVILQLSPCSFAELFGLPMVEVAGAVVIIIAVVASMWLAFALAAPDRPIKKPHFDLLVIRPAPLRPHDFKASASLRPKPGSQGVGPEI